MACIGAGVGQGGLALCRKWMEMGKKSSDGEKPQKQAQALRVATVVKPCLIGCTVLMIAAAALPS